MRPLPSALSPMQASHATGQATAHTAEQESGQPGASFDFEEDTLLPPPAPGLVAPSAEHLFDPPTWPGLGIPARQVNVEEVQAADHFADPDPTPRTLSLAGGLSAQTVETLPALPHAPLTDSAAALLTYLFQVTRNRVLRHRIAARVERSLRAEGETLDRLLADLGQYGYIEQVDLLELYPAAQPIPSGIGAAPSTSPRDAAESWAARIEAEQLRTLAVLAREEARLTSELLRCVEARQQDESLAGEPAFLDEFELLLGRLAAVRVERWVQERARSHCQRHAVRLLATLQNLIMARSSHSEARRLPNLLLLGALLASQRTLSSTRAVEPWFMTVPGRPAGVQLSPTLFQALWRFQDRLLPRVVLCARASVERLSYDKELLQRGLMLLAVAGSTLLACVLILYWALS